MSPRNWEERLNDILDAIHEIQSFIEGTEFSVFKNDLKTLRAIELNLMIIGEAANSVPEEVQVKYPHVAWQLMRGLRNRIVHSYFSIAPAILWDTIQQDLPPLADELRKILQD